MVCGLRRRLHRPLPIFTFPSQPSLIKITVLCPLKKPVVFYTLSQR